MAGALRYGSFLGMITMLIGLLFFKAAVAHAGLGFVNCQGYLMGISPATDQKVYRETAHKRFADDMDDEDNIAAYVGISHETLLQLLERGEVKLSENGAPFDVIATSDHDAGASFLIQDPRSKGYDWRRDAASEMASYSAQIQTAYDMVVARIEPQLLSRDASRNLIRVLRALEIPNDTDDKSTYSPTILELRKALLAAPIPHPEPTSHADYETQVLIGKAVPFARALGLKTEISDFKRLEWQQRFAALFAKIPLSTGYILGVPAKYLIGQDRAHQAETRVLHLEDVAGIEPLNKAGFQFLDGLKDY